MIGNTTVFNGMGGNKTITTWFIPNICFLKMNVRGQKNLVINWWVTLADWYTCRCWCVVFFIGNKSLTKGKTGKWIQILFVVEVWEDTGRMFTGGRFQWVFRGKGTKIDRVREIENNIVWRYILPSAVLRQLNNVWQFYFVIGFQVFCFRNLRLNFIVFNDLRRYPIPMCSVQYVFFIDCFLCVFFVYFHLKMLCYWFVHICWISLELWWHTDQDRTQTDG